MRNFTLLLSLLCFFMAPPSPAATPIGTLGTTPDFNVCGVNSCRRFTDLTNLLILYAHCIGAGGANGTFRLTSGTAGYLVPGGKTLRINAILVRGTASSSAKFAQSDNDVTVDSATALTNPVYVSGDIKYDILFPSVAGNESMVPMSFPVATGKYFTMACGGGTTDQLAIAFGYLE
jgi:hypothetical protein